MMIKGVSITGVIIWVVSEVQPILVSAGGLIAFNRNNKLIHFTYLTISTNTEGKQHIYAFCKLILFVTELKLRSKNHKGITSCLCFEQSSKSVRLPCTPLDCPRRLIEDGTCHSWVCVSLCATWEHYSCCT